MVKTAAYLRTHAFRVSEHLREKRDEGATATEYGLLVAMIAIIVVVGVNLFGTSLSNWLRDLGTTVSNLPN